MQTSLRHTSNYPYYDYDSSLYQASHQNFEVVNQINLGLTSIEHTRDQHQRITSDHDQPQQSLEHQTPIAFNQHQTNQILTSSYDDHGASIEQHYNNGSIEQDCHIEFNHDTSQNHIYPEHVNEREQGQNYRVNGNEDSLLVGPISSENSRAHNLYAEDSFRRTPVSAHISDQANSNQPYGAIYYDPARFSGDSTGFEAPSYSIILGQPEEFSLQLGETVSSTIASCHSGPPISISQQVPVMHQLDCQQRDDCMGHQPVNTNEQHQYVHFSRTYPDQHLQGLDLAYLQAGEPLVGQAQMDSSRNCSSTDFKNQCADEEEQTYSEIGCQKLQDLSHLNQVSAHTLNDLNESSHHQQTLEAIVNNNERLSGAEGQTQSLFSQSSFKREQETNFSGHVHHQNRLDSTGQSSSSITFSHETDSSAASTMSSDESSLMTRDERRAKEANIPMSYEDIVNLSIEQFNEQLAQFNLTEAQSTLMKDIRRRGKNKVAAQSCRKRKMEQINELEMEVNQLANKRGSLSNEYTKLIEEHKNLVQEYNRIHERLLKSNLQFIDFQQNSSS